MPTTTNYGWTYPDSSGSTQLWTHFQTLATGIDTSLKTVANAVPYSTSQTLAASAASVTFSSIPRTLKSLRLLLAARGDTAAAFAQVIIRFGGDTSAVYSYAVQYYSGGASSAATNTGMNLPYAGYIPAASATAGRFGCVEIAIAGWDSPTGHTTGCQYRFQGGYIAGTNYVTAQGSGEYFGTATLNSITLLPIAGNFVAGSEFVLTGTY
jgi:hypothetical protein